VSGTLLSYRPYADMCVFFCIIQTSIIQTLQKHTQLLSWRNWPKLSYRPFANTQTQCKIESGAPKVSMWHRDMNGLHVIGCTHSHTHTHTNLYVAQGYEWASLDAHTHTHTHTHTSLVRNDAQSSLHWMHTQDWERRAKSLYVAQGYEWASLDDWRGYEWASFSTALDAHTRTHTHIIGA